MPIKNKFNIKVDGIPDYLPDPIADDCRMQLVQSVEELLSSTGLDGISIQVGAGDPPAEEKPVTKTPRDVAGLGAGRRPSIEFPPGPRNDEMSIEERAEQYLARVPLYDFDFLVVPDEVQENLLSAVDLLRVEETVFDKWNLRSIEPYPRSALNLHGPSGTGKTLAAHAIASYLGKRIILGSYGQIESKFVGDSSKNIAAVFHAAERDEAVLFIDEADSLLSRRLTTIHQGADQAINSMRSQLLISLEQYAGLVIFSTNLIENYDQAFETRMRHVRFPRPDEVCRREIWKRHLPEELPLAEDVDTEVLGAIEGLCGRDIKNAVIDAALRAARNGYPRIELEDLRKAVARLEDSRFRRRDQDERFVETKQPEAPGGSE